MTAQNPFEYGLVGLALLVVWKGLDLVGAQWKVKRGIPLPCQSDPGYHARMQSIDANTEALNEALTRGDLKCAWHGRDEVRDLLECMRALTGEIRAWRAEMRTTRSG